MGRGFLLDNYILWFDELGMNDVDLVGGKNASLGEMISNLAGAGVSVPNGFATTAHAYGEFLAHKNLADRINQSLAALDVDDVIAHLIVAEGYLSINDIANTSIDELNSIEGFEEELSIELKERAQNYVKLQNENVEKKLKSSGIDSKLYEFSHLSKFDILTLVENDIKTLDDLADLDSEELFTLLGKKVFNNENEAGEIIMEARKHWFDEDYKK